MPIKKNTAQTLGRFFLAAVAVIRSLVCSFVSGSSDFFVCCSAASVCALCIVANSSMFMQSGVFRYRETHTHTNAKIFARCIEKLDRVTEKGMWGRERKKKNWKSWSTLGVRARARQEFAKFRKFWQSERKQSRSDNGLWALSMSRAHPERVSFRKTSVFRPREGHSFSNARLNAIST